MAAWISRNCSTDCCDVGESAPRSKQKQFTGRWGFLLAREAMSTLLAQRFYTGSEQDVAIARIQDAFEDAADLAEI